MLRKFGDSMIYITDCAECKHRREKIDGWIPCCDAFPNGMPDDFKYYGLKEKAECNPENHIGFEKKNND